MSATGQEEMSKLEKKKLIYEKQIRSLSMCAVVSVLISQTNVIEFMPFQILNTFKIKHR